MAATMAISSCGTSYRGSLTQDELGRVTINPVQLNYQFQNETPSRREAADPVCEYFNGKYYLFASKSNGYWSSDDMNHWKYIAAPSIKTIQNYAPTVMVRNGAMWWIASGSTQIYRTDDPESGVWHEVPTKFNYGMTDPCLFDDGDHVYMYWGCSDKDPIVGVEVNPDDGFAPIGRPDTLIRHNIAEHGWEAGGHNNERNTNGFNEGATMNKFNGKYYLQYASPGTQYKVYADGVYVGDSPLAPFRYQRHNPFVFKPGGFIYGAGHGHTFTDRHGNLWHAASMAVSVRHGFERRLGLFPTYLTADGTLASNTELTDFPFLLPAGKTDFEHNNLSLGWMPLAYGKATRASSVLRGAMAEKAKEGFENPWKTESFEPANAVNEEIGNWWAAATGKAGEWLEVDMGRRMDVNAVHVNFADHGIQLGEHSTFIYKYTVECSDDGINWKMLVDKSHNTADMPHELNVMPEAVTTRYLRITNRENLPAGALFSVSGLRVFGRAAGKVPARVDKFSLNTDDKDRRHITVSWTPSDGATGYIVRWGNDPKKMHSSYMIYGDTQIDARFLNTGEPYYFTVDAFNESGIKRGKKVLVRK